MEPGSDIHAITEKVRQESALVDRILQEMDRVGVGQRYMVERLIIGMLCGGHVPGGRSRAGQDAYREHVGADHTGQLQEASVHPGSSSRRPNGHAHLRPAHR